jgi:hypothetical protein
MAEPLLITMLREKANELEAQIATSETMLEQMRADLVHVLAVMALVAGEDPNKPHGVLFNMKRLFKRGELLRYCEQALAGGVLPSGALADYIIKNKPGLDPTNKALRRAVATRVSQSLSKLNGRPGAKVELDHMRAGRSYWRLALAVTR